MSIERTVGPIGANALVQSLPRPAARAAQAAVAAPPVDLRSTVDNLNRYLRSVDQGVQFELDETTGARIVRVVDRETSKVIRQFPSEEMLAVARTMAKLQGLLLDDTA